MLTDLTAMRFAGLCFLLLLTGGSTSELQQQTDDGPESVQSFEEMPGGNFSELEPSGDFWDEPELHLMPNSVDMSFMENPDPEHFPQIFEHIRENEPNISEECSFQAVLNHLKLTKSSNKYIMSRPVKHHNHLTWILLEMKIYSILDVRETDQTFISYIWVYLRWDNEHIWWDPNQFCGIDHILVPTQYLWMPDLTIEEMTEQDKASPSPYFNIRSYGWVEFRNDQVVISSCKMRVYKFPFDVQSCNISFKSIMHSDEEIKLFYHKNNTEITERSRESIQTQYEWVFVNMTVTSKTVKHFGFNQTMIVYTINMQRRSVLYIANFLLPILFFLCLDFASLLMSDTGGDKIGFKITVLLAVTVMQLILNDILPSSSDKIPLIAVYCIGIFGLMLLSLLETILVMHLIDKDASQDNEPTKNQSLNEGNESNQNNSRRCFLGTMKQSGCASVNNKSADGTPSEVPNSQCTEVSLTLEKLSDELGEIRETLALLSCGKEDQKPSYWTGVAQKINKAFAIFYVITATLFLLTIFTMWYFADE
ncbi:5-hydroxytryptamine receptor 3A [Kryptolebias marmoratus]|uniref:5-hydroxytryptamine receptor 3A-like n=1 Tax=Kryptolebias marmoratus TaxID=37003 RepID=A0A3Q3A737_KRYMA|nr:5-hydroxytryptamine receptor 3A [Kryptolebias marmoratus]